MGEMEMGYVFVFRNKSISTRAEIKNKIWKHMYITGIVCTFASFISLSYLILWIMAMVSPIIEVIQRSYFKNYKTYSTVFLNTYS